MWLGDLENNMMVMARFWGQQGKALLTCAYRHQRQGAENSLSVTRLVFYSLLNQSSLKLRPGAYFHLE